MKAWRQKLQIRRCVLEPENFKFCQIYVFSPHRCTLPYQILPWSVYTVAPRMKSQIWTNLEFWGSNNHPRSFTSLYTVPSPEWYKSGERHELPQRGPRSNPGRTWFDCSLSFPSLFHSRLKTYTSFTNLSHHRLPSSLRTDSTDFTTFWASPFFVISFFIILFVWFRASD